MKSGNETLLLATRMIDKLTEWSVEEIMPVFNRVDFYTSTETKIQATRTLNGINNGYLRIRKTSIDDEHIVQGSHLDNITFSQLQNTLRRAARNMKKDSLNTKISRANVLYNGYDFQWVQHSSYDLEHDLRKELIGKNKSGLLGSNSPINRNMVLILSNVSEIPPHIFKRLVSTSERHHIPLVHVKELLTQEKKVRISYMEI